MRMLLAVLLGVLAVSVAVVSVAEATPASPVTIVTEIDFSSLPFSGSFTVPVGSGTLGCSAGTFVDFPRSSGAGVIEKHFTCSSGPGSGDTFVVLIHPLISGFPGPGVANGPWNANDGTGDFAKLHGGGDLSLVFTGPVSGEETLTGSIHFD